MKFGKVSKNLLGVKSHSKQVKAFNGVVHTTFEALKFQKKACNSSNK